jgi:hypothetical protein
MQHGHRSVILVSLTSVLGDQFSALLKLFCDIFIGAVTGAARCDFFIGESFDLLVVGYGRTRWISRFTWFRLSERNTVCLRENRVVLLKSSLARASLSHFSVENLFLTPVKRCLPGPFIAQGRVVTMGPDR